MNNQQVTFTVTLNDNEVAKNIVDTTFALGNYWIGKYKF